MNLLRVYGECFVKALKAVGLSPWTLLLPMAYLALKVPLGAFAASLGILGGFLFTLAQAALAASLLYVVSELVSRAPVRLREMPQSARPFFWPILNVAFVFWVAQLLLGPLLSRAPNGRAIQFALDVTLFVVFNAVPEVIYQKGTFGGLAAIEASVKFIQEHWIEWLIPNLAIGAAFWFGLQALRAVPLAFAIEPIASGALLLWAMVFRGYLFEALDGSNARQRALRYRLGGR